ncbi:MAG TPA: hypothetical protein VNZ57_06900 [Longimicrobiales bacterium]|nr:hypothetical protein [Longimicrobiales bacterium]
MSPKTMRLLAAAFFASCVTTMALAGDAVAQAVAMAVAMAMALPLAFGLMTSPAATGYSKLCAIALLGTIGFASWNLLGQPNPRWAHRAFIYTGYSAAVALILLATVLDTKNRTDKQIWYIAGGVHVAATVSMALVKACFVERMMADLP